MAETPAPKIQLVDGEGQFLDAQLEQFVQATRLPESKGNYQVVAIMGPQSSGKSTLLNHVVRAGLLLGAVGKGCVGSRWRAGGSIADHERVHPHHTPRLAQFGTTFVMMDALTGRSQTTKVRDPGGRRAPHVVRVACGLQPAPAEALSPMALLGLQHLPFAPGFPFLHSLHN